MDYFKVKYELACSQIYIEDSDFFLVRTDDIDREGVEMLRKREIEILEGREIEVQRD